MVAAIGAKNCCFSRNSSFLWTIEDLFSSHGRKLSLDYSMLDTGHPRKHLGTLQVVSIHGFNAFSSQKSIPRVHFMHTCRHPMTSLPQKQCHLVVGHTPSYTVSNSEVNRTDSSRDTATSCIIPLSLNFPQSDHYQHLTTQHLRHGLRTDTMMPQQLITQSAQATADALLPVHWQLGQPP